jgi:hypothetical protein
MVKLLNLVEAKIRATSNPTERLGFVMAGAYFCFCYVVSLRSPNGLMADIPGLVQFGETSVDYFVTPLLGQVKGEKITLISTYFIA